MAQERVRDRIAKGVPGVIFGDDPTVVSKTNQNPQAEQVEQVTVDTANDDTEYTIEINGVSVTYTSGTGATLASIRDGLIEAVEDEPLVSGHVVAEPGGTDAVLTLTAQWPGEGFDFQESDANLSSSQTQASGEADPIPFGRAVVVDGLSLEEGGQGARLAEDAAISGNLNDIFAGVSAVKHMTAYDDGAQIGPNDIFDVLESGKIIVDPEDTPSQGDGVYVRTAADGDNDELGRFRASSATGCTELTGASWHGVFDDGNLAVLTID